MEEIQKKQVVGDDWIENHHPEFNIWNIIIITSMMQYIHVLILIVHCEDSAPKAAIHIAGFVS